MTAVEIARTFYELALLLELKGESSFKVRAFQNTAKMLESLTEPLEKFVMRCRSGGVSGVGPQLTDSLELLFERGHLPLYDELKEAYPPGIFEIFKLPGVGPKKIKQLYEELQIGSINELHSACRENKLAGLKGFGAKTQQKILNGIEQYWIYNAQALYVRAKEESEALLAALANSGLALSAEISGDLRRALPVIESMELTATAEHREQLGEHFATGPWVASRVEVSPERAEVVLQSGMRAVLHIAEQSSVAKTLLRSTGSAAFLVELGRLAETKGVDLESHRFASEEELFRSLELAFVPPERRETRDVLQEARFLFERGESFNPPVERSAIKGILHAHSTYSDGRNTLAEMAGAVAALGYEYLGISDHSQSAIYANGLKEAAIRKQHQEIDELNEQLAPFHIFKGIEADILIDGSLDYPPEILSLFDFVIVSIHSRFSISEAEMTARIIKAVSNPFTTILAHPTGRLLLKREGYSVDIPAVLQAAAAHGVSVELNCNPRRLDLDWQHLDAAAALGISVPLSPDAHSVKELAYVDHGLRTLRKTSLRAENVLNSRSRKELAEHFLKKKGAA